MVDTLIRAGIELHTVTSEGPVKSVQAVLLADEERDQRSARIKAGLERAKRIRGHQEPR